MKYLSEQKGVAMPLVLVILVVLSLLGTAIWQYSMSELNQSVREEKKAQAHYLARAGAESIARSIMNEPSILDAIPEIGNSTTAPDIDFFNTTSVNPIGQIDVTIERISNYQVEVTGLGIVDGVQQSVSLLLETNPSYDFGPIYSTNTLKFNNSTNVYGSIVSGGDVYWGNNKIETTEYSKVIDGTITTGVNMSFNSPVFPTKSESYSGPTYNIDSNTTINSSQSPLLAYRKIDINKNNVILTVDATSGPIFIETQDFDMHNGASLVLITKSNNEIVLVGENFFFSNVILKGDGIVKLYIRNSLTLQTPNSSVGPEPGSTARLIVYIEENKTMAITANAEFTGLVYAPDAYVIMQASQSTFNGSMIVNELSGHGNNGIMGDINYLDLWGDLIDQDFNPAGYIVVHWMR